MLISLHKSTIRFSGTRAAEGVKRRQRGDKYNIDFDSFCCQAGVCVRERWAGVRERGCSERKTILSRASPSVHTPESNVPWFVNIYQTPMGGGGKVPGSFRRFPRRQKQYPSSRLGKRTPGCLERLGAKLSLALLFLHSPSRVVPSFLCSPPLSLSPPFLPHSWPSLLLPYPSPFHFLYQTG